MSVQVTITGNLAADPELRFTPTGQAVANMSVAVNHRKLNKQTNEWVDDGTDWYRIVAWGALAEATSELSKGNRVIVKGQLRQRQYEKDGQTRTTLEIVADDIGHSLRHRKPTPQTDPWAATQPTEPPF